MIQLHYSIKKDHLGFYIRRFEDGDDSIYNVCCLGSDDCWYWQSGYKLVLHFENENKAQEALNNHLWSITPKMEEEQKIRLESFYNGKASALEEFSALAKHEAGLAFANHEDEAAKLWRDISARMKERAQLSRQAQKQYERGV